MQITSTTLTPPIPFQNLRIGDRVKKSNGQTAIVIEVSLWDSSLRLQSGVYIIVEETDSLEYCGFKRLNREYSNKESNLTQEEFEVLFYRLYTKLVREEAPLLKDRVLTTIIPVNRG